MVLESISTYERKNMNSNSEICVAPKTLAIVMRQRKDGKQPAKRITGERLFIHFKRANAGCTWNIALRAAIRKMVFVGYLRSHTLLVYGTTDHIEALRSAWMKNLLVAPEGFSLLYFGELPTMFIEPISHTTFTPLPDALCSVILQMNRNNIPATFKSIRQQLESVYKHIQPPADLVVYEALNTLIKDKKICLTDIGYFISCESTRPLSVNVCQDYAPGFLMSPPKSSPESKDIPTDRPTSNNAHSKPGNRRRKSLNNPKVRPNEKGTDKIDTEFLKTRNAWKERQAQATKAKGKDKGMAFRRLFSIKSKPKKVCSKVGGSTGTYSGSSSSHSPRNSNDEESVNTGGLLLNANPYIMDSRTSSQLTSAAVPYKISPPSYSNQLSDSLQVHCGRTVMSSPCSLSDCDQESDNNRETEDCVPEIKSIRRQKQTATHFGMRRQTANPTIATRQIKTGSTSSDDVSVPIPTAEMYFTQKKYRSAISSATRNSTHVEGSSGYVMNLPNISNISAPPDDEIHILTNSPDPLPSTGTTEDFVSRNTEQRKQHHSTPIDDSLDETTLRHNETEYRRQENATPQTKLSSKVRRTVEKSICCDCKGKIKCACSCHESDSSVYHNIKSVHSTAERNLMAHV